ncbi:hypothetical protein GCM10022255_012520 [Dactylosporangium darangshiense]|uniref:Uncharacterized protein n=1 Tax=Dactylosporangium darangshiense TaxID=579108 RepID=A0ABP8D061_9ACTN
MSEPPAPAGRYRIDVETWEVRRADGEPAAGSAFDDRVAALAHALRLRVETGADHRVDGPGEPACATNRDLYRRLVAEGVRIRGSGRDLAAFLRGWRLAGRAFDGREWLEADEVAAMIVAAGTLDPGADDPAWRSAQYEYVEEPATFAEWEAIVLSQLADLADFAEQGPLDPMASFGTDAPRPEGCRRATMRRWYNFDPRTYLECGVAGTLGGWDEEDGLRIPVPGPYTLLRPEPEPGHHPVGVLGWDVLAELARCGQEYE